MSELAETSQEIPCVVSEEQKLLDKVRRHLTSARVRRPIGADYDEEMISLRDQIAQARPEDIPPLVEQMTRLQALAAQRGMGQEAPVDKGSPYFGHIRFEEEEGTRDVLLGKSTYISPEHGIRIVDWRNAPISRMYYTYDEGDDYEEIFGGRLRRGHVSARRSVTITGGELRRVATSSEIFTRKSGRWVCLDPESMRLAGGQGSAIRAEGLAPVRGKLGVDAAGEERSDRHLPEIAALLDTRQFELISSPGSGIVVVQGSAGSGKTTVGLHRIAYLAFDKPNKFKPHRMLVVVFNVALVNYISRVLPALGVSGVRVVTFADWAAEQRRKHVKGLPAHHSDDTPSVVTRLKKHPAMLRILDDVVDRQDEELSAKLTAAVAGTPDARRVEAAWQTLRRLPLETRRLRVLRWLDGEARVGRDRGAGLASRTATAAELALERMADQTRDVVSDWSELLTDRTALGEAFGFHAPAEFSEAELDEAHAWCVRVHESLEGEDEEIKAAIDLEDEAILLRLYQLKVGWLRGRQKRLEFDHIMVDEVQDFSPIEVAVLMETAGDSRSVTLAGDTAQRIYTDNGFAEWEDLLGDLGLEAHRIEPLQIAYRSTAEIMRVARDVLGPLAKEQSQAPRHGAPVELHRFSDPGQAVGFLGEALRDLSAREPMANVAVIARHASQARIYYDGLAKAEIPKLRLVVDEDFSFKPGVEVTEIRQVKGLEFDYVVIVEANADTFGANDESRHLFHVAATRAAHQLWVVSTAAPSPILPAWLVGDDSGQ